MSARRMFWIAFSILHRLFDIVQHYMFKIAYWGRREELPPITNLLLLSSATSLAAKIRKRNLKSVDVVTAYISRVKEVNPFLNAVISQRFEAALEEAEKVDKFLAEGGKSEEEIERETPFLGVPFSVKELISVEGFPLTAGLVSRKGIKSSNNAQTVQLMKKAGGIPFVSTNISELGMWPECYNKVYGRTSNPYDTSRTCGGSSGGEGALIGAAGSIMGLGSDIGGSIRIPSFFNGIFGHKPTPDVVSNYGSYPRSSEREFVPYLVIGPMCRYATDLIPSMKVLTGKNVSILQLDSAVKLNELKVFYIEDIGNHVMYSKVERDLLKSLHKVLYHFENAYKIKATKVNLNSMKNIYPMWAAALANCQAPSFSDELAEKKGKINFKLEFLQWFIGQSRFTFPAILLGLTELINFDKQSYMSSVEDLSRDLKAILGDDGILILPTHPRCAPHHNQMLFQPFNFAYTAVFNILGLPVTHVPLGLGVEGLPTGVQVVSNKYNDRLTMAVAVELEKVFGGWVAPCPIV